jgi:hypothetical protein
MRSMSGPAALAARGQIHGRPQAALLLAATGELAADKTSAAPDRTEPIGLGGRVGTGALTGYAIGGPVGAAVAAVSAGAGTYSTWRVRKLVVSATGLPDPVIAAGEDILAYLAIAAATQRVGEAAEPVDAIDATQESIGTPETARPSVVKNAAKGLVAGLVGTATMTLAQGAEYVLTPARPSDAPAQVADKLSRRLGLGRIKRRNKAAVNQGMHWLYGSAWGIPYGVFAATAKARPELTGPMFGLLVWGVGLAQEPALGIADPPWKRSVQSLGSEAFFHVVYGIGAGAALRVLRNAPA